MNSLSSLLARMTFLRWLALVIWLAGTASSALAAKAYSDNGNGTVTDPTTGLVWMRCAMGQSWNGSSCAGTASAYTWDQANRLNNAVNFGGHADWRLPNIRELQTIVDRSVFNPALDKLAFPNTPASYFWSATAYANSSDYAWFVHFYSGYASNYSRDNALQVRLVRSGQSAALLTVTRPSTDYVIQGDGTVTHTPSGLMWQRCAIGQRWNGTLCSGTASTFTWDDARLLTSSFAGQSDWRLPTEDELLSLVDYTKSLPALNGTLFPNTSAAFFWSASTDVSSTDDAWLGYFSNGYAYNYFKTYASQVRLVRTVATGTSTTTTSTTSTVATTTTTVAATTTTRASTTTTTVTSTTTTTQRAVKTYSDNGDGTVTDPTTGLVWMRCSAGQAWSGTTCTGLGSTYTWNDAIALTNTVSYAGHSDWRLPSIRELQTIVDRSLFNPAIDSRVFPNTPSAYYWTSTPVADQSGDVWLVYFNLGYVQTYVPSNYFNVRLVRAGQATGLLDVARPSTDYVAQVDGTVIHTPTGLMWQRCAVGQNWTGSTCSGTASSVTWDAARLLTSSFAGQSDWRLPTEEELISLVDYSRFAPAINGTLFPAIPSLAFWSASPQVSGTVDAWNADLNGGGARYSGRTSNNAVRLVRVVQPVVNFRLAVSKTGAGQVSGSLMSGINCGTLCSASYTPGTLVTLTAAPTVSFMAWGGDCASAGTAPNCTVTMDAAKTVSASFRSAPLAVQSGWNLMGNGHDQPLTVATLFSAVANVKTVWKWDVVSSRWQFYAPSMTPAALQDYVNRNGYGLLISINPGEGFWVNAVQAFLVTAPAGTALSGADFAAGKPYALKTGWNLAAIGNPVTPSAFNLGLSALPPAAGVVPINLTSLWAWDNPQSKWYFYAPNLEAQGGAALLNYTTSKGYLDFSADGKTLDNGVGFWVSKQ